MKYSLELDLDLPRDRVVELFDDPNNLQKWQPTLISFELISGETRQVGAKSKLRYREGRDELEMVETITSRNPPDEFTGTYETKGVWNRVRNKFVEIGPDKTRWAFETEFRCSGFMRFVSLIVPSTFKSASLKNMHRFKAFAEHQ